MSTNQIIDLSSIEFVIKQHPVVRTFYVTILGAISQRLIKCHYNFKDGKWKVSIERYNFTYPIPCLADVEASTFLTYIMSICVPLPLSLPLNINGDYYTHITGFSLYSSLVYAFVSVSLDPYEQSVKLRLLYGDDLPPSAVELLGSYGVHNVLWTVPED